MAGRLRARGSAGRLALDEIVAGRGGRHVLCRRRRDRALSDRDRQLSRQSRVRAAKLWVALRPTGGEPPYALFAVTADPAEGEAWTETGSDLVDTVAMPAPVQAQIARFVAEHHVERPFYKRQRDETDVQGMGGRGSAEKEPQ